MLRDAAARPGAMGASARGRVVAPRVGAGPRLAVAVPIGMWLAIMADGSRTGLWVTVAALVLVAYVALRPGPRSLVWALLAYTFSFGGAQAGTLPDVPVAVPWIGYALIAAVALPPLLWRWRSLGTRVA